MSLRISTRRLAPPAGPFQCLSQPTSRLLPHITIRTAFFKPIRGKTDDVKTKGSGVAGLGGRSANPILDEYLRKKPSMQEGGLQRPQQGKLAETSIFADEDEAQLDSESTPAEVEPEPELDPNLTAIVLDPAAKARRRWERKKVIHEIRKGGRVSRRLMIKRTEREHLAKSHYIKTSTKKLGMLARQISGKTLEEAMTQMRFSKKKAARDILKHLQYARDQAIAMRGMGLGKAEGKTWSPKEIQLKDGKRHLVEDRTNMYIDQAWVGSGGYRVDYDYRARGRTYILKKPYTSISILLKEEHTRVREHEDREKKRANRKLWVQLPDRPITSQHQYYTW